MANWLNDQLTSLGVETKLVDLGKQELEGQVLDLPPAILGTIGKDPAKKTVLIYGHFDVQPVSTVTLSQYAKLIIIKLPRHSNPMAGTPILSPWL